MSKMCAMPILMPACTYPERKKRRLMRRKDFYRFKKVDGAMPCKSIRGSAIDRQKRVQLDANATPRLVVPGRQY